MSFNPDKNKQAQEVVFSHKQSKPKHLQLLFNNSSQNIFNYYLITHLLLILPVKSTLG